MRYEVALNPLECALDEAQVLRRQVDALQAENAKLFALLKHESEQTEKLRELLLSYWKRTHSPAAPNVERNYLAEMRELGVEVE